MNWEVSWSTSLGGQDFDVNAVIAANSATDAVTKFIQLFNTLGKDIDWERQCFRAEKNHTFFLFTLEDGKLRRI